MPTFWTTDEEIQFHKTIHELSQRMQTPNSEIDYREHLRDCEQRQEYVLSLHHEMQIADHLAYLTHTSEGSSKITAICVEERPDSQGLLIRLACNDLQNADEIAHIQDLLKTMQECALKGM
jgi:hypothetical protein